MATLNNLTVSYVCHVCGRVDTRQVTNEEIITHKCASKDGWGSYDIFTDTLDFCDKPECQKVLRALNKERYL